MLERNSYKKRPLLWMQVLTITITLIAVALAILFGSRVHIETREMATEQFNQQQLILAHSAAAGIEAYYQELSGALSALAQLPCIQQITPECLQEMQHTYHGFPLRTSIRLLDSNGILRFIYPFEGWRGELIGRDYSGEAYFQRARETGRISVSGLVINEQGDARIRVAVPLYLTHETERVQVGGEIGDIVTPIDPSRPGAGEFQGVLVGSIDPRIIDQNFISPVVSGETGYAWLLNENGVFVAHHNEEFIGRNAFEVQAERNTGDSYQAIEQIQRRMIAGEEGTSRYVSNWHQEEIDEIEELIAYAPAHIGEHVWSVAVCAPVSEVEQVIQFAKRAEQYTLALVILSLTVGGLSLFTTSYRWSRSLEQEVDRRTKELRETIAERKQAEEALRESELRYRTTLDSMADAIHLVGPDLRLTLINPTYKQIFRGLVSDTTDIIGRTVFEAFPSMPDEIRARVRDEYDRVFRTGETLVTEESTMLGDREVIIETRKIPIFEQGRVAQVVTVMRDVTERNQARREIETRRSYLESVLACAPDAIVTLDYQHNILEWNQGAERLFGYTWQEVVGRNIDDLITGPDTNVFEGATGWTQLALAGKNVPPTETFLYRKDGSLANVITSGSPILIGGKVSGVIAVYTDITERKRIEEQLRQQERLAAVGQLASGIAHDFNNILTIIMLYAQIAVGKSEGNLPPSAAQAFEIIIDESHKASQLVQQILDFSRHAMLNVQWLDLGTVTEEVIDVLQRMIPEDIHLTLEVELGEQAAPLVVQADSIRMQQVLVNLVTNARDAMPEGGDLRFGLSRVTLKPGEAVPVAEMSPGEWVCLAVSDTGTGMAEEVRSRIFEPFFTTKPVGEGTGLGLAQVYGIVRQHGGYIGVETEVGKGTTFHIYLPASAAGEEIAEEQGTALPQGQGETILLVEDKKKLRKTGQEILESLGYRVLTGANGREALETYRSAGEVDLVIADLVMPEMGGKELMRALREMQPTLKGLAITGYIVEEEVQELKKVGFLDTVYKPFKMDTLARMVRRALDED